MHVSQWLGLTLILVSMCACFYMYSIHSELQHGVQDVQKQTALFILLHNITLFLSICFLLRQRLLTHVDKV